MPVAQLNHVTVRTDDLEGTRDFYHDMLGLKARPRPPLGFPGYWLYAGENPLVHLVPKSHGIGAEYRQFRSCRLQRGGFQRHARAFERARHQVS